MSLSQGLTGRTILAEENNIEAIHSQAKGEIEGGQGENFQQDRRIHSDYFLPTFTAKIHNTKVNAVDTSIAITFGMSSGAMKSDAYATPKVTWLAAIRIAANRSDSRRDNFYRISHVSIP